MKLAKIPRGTAIQIAAGLSAVAIWMTPAPELKTIDHETASLPASPVLPADNAVLPMRQLTARPLFTQTRRPPPPVKIAAAAIPKPVPTTDGMILLGILRDPSHSIALVSLPGERTPRRVELGDHLGEWAVKKISADRLLLRSGDTNAELALPRPAPNRMAPGAPQMAAPFLRAP